MTVSAYPRASLFLAVLAVTALACTVSAPPPTDPPATPPPATSAPAGGGGTSGNRGDPNAPIGVQPPAMDPNRGDGALHVEPQPGIVDARPHAWDRISVAADGRTITVYYWGGVEDCYGLDRVDVSTDDEGRPVIRVFEGRRGALPPDTACIEIALLKAVTLELDEPIVVPSQ